jgi:hypothetical protein
MICLITSGCGWRVPETRAGESYSLDLTVQARFVDFG